ncbi:MAG: hypothetical protein ACMXYE_01020 [Candidatus Woesearchaeota archaeon]
MKKTIKNIVTPLLIGSTLAAQPQLTTGFNAIEALTQNEQRLYTNVGVSHKENDLMYHGTHVCDNGSYFSNHRVSAQVGSSKIRPMAHAKTNYSGWNDIQVGVRINSFPGADFGYLELSANENVAELTGLAGKIIDMPVLGNVQLEAFNQFSYDGKEISHFGEIYALKAGNKIQPFVLVGARDVKNPYIKLGVRGNF